LGEGQFCVAVLVETDIVVRFPRHALGIEHLLHERKVVEILGGRLDVVVPAPLAAELDNPPGQAFAATGWCPETWSPGISSMSSAAATQISCTTRSRPCSWV
jgi:hypothetical protein